MSERGKEIVSSSQSPPPGENPTLRGMKFLRLMACAAGVLYLTGCATAEVKSTTGAEVMLMASFRGDGEDGLHLAWSTNGLHWDALNQDRAVLPATVGESQLMRDPCLQQGPDGTFHLVWTTAWEGKTIGYANSKDLVHWSEPVALSLMENEPRTKLCWAPEMRWDAAKQHFLVYWTSSLKGESPEYWRTYATTTKDFKTFTPTKLFFDPGHSQIDASILPADGKFYLFYKHSWQGNRYAVADKLDGPYTNPAPLFTNDEWEGAWPLRTEGGYFAYIDRFKSRERMGLWFSPDLVSWTNISAQTSFPRGTLHCSVLKVKRSAIEEVVRLAEREMAIEPPTPIIEGFTADPDIAFFDGKFYVYPTSDKENWQTTDFSTWSSADLINWKNEGMILDVTKDLKWAKIRAWAPAMVRRNGTYYFYFCAEQKIGVATNNAPFGRFTDALEQPLVSPSREYPGQAIDPFAFIDDDGQAYLFYGQGNLYARKLKADMISFDGPPVKLTPRRFNEGVAVFKRNGTYYFMWSQNDARDVRYEVAYGTAKSPLGPIMVPRDNVVLQQRGRAIGTGHHGVVQVPGTDRWYVTYHRHAIPDGNGYQRQTCLVRMEFTADGRIKKMNPLEPAFAPGAKGESVAKP